MTRRVALALAVLLAVPLATLAAANGAPKAAAKESASKATVVTNPKAVTLPDGLQYTDLVIGTGPMPRPGQTAIVHYTGTFVNGTKFDSSRDRKEPYPFAVGRHDEIACWDEGVATMRVGGRRKLVCPPALAFGDRGAGGVIPPNATLHFDVELLAIK
jgi:peptidylprolyl isomerase